jgi:phosphatidylinositol glycan class A protein
MVCDFFHPSVGGVEKHVYALSLSLMRLGHRVVVLTHQYGDLRGVRVLPGGLKVYYASVGPAFWQCILPTGGMLLLPALRSVVLRERITIVHTHALCTMAMESTALSSLLGCRVVHTQHSNFELTGVIPRLQAAMESAVFAQTHGLIAVSRAARDNMCARCGIPPAAVRVIPNAVDACSFVPAPQNIWPRQLLDGRPCINVVFLARLVRSAALPQA